jgi:DNA topoisomerase I
LFGRSPEGCDGDGERSSELLGNTPAVCRSSYIDPRVIDRFNDGESIAPPLHKVGPDVIGTARRLDVERAVIELLGVSTEAAA